MLVVIAAPRIAWAPAATSPALEPVPTSALGPLWVEVRIPVWIDASTLVARGGCWFSDNATHIATRIVFYDCGDPDCPVVELDTSCERTLGTCGVSSYQGMVSATAGVGRSFASAAGRDVCVVIGYTRAGDDSAGHVQWPPDTTPLARY
jgi:hypothetical protein